MKCYAVNPSLLLNLINNNFFFLTEISILNLYLPQKSENLGPHSSNSIENATHYSQSSTPSSGTSPSYPILPYPIPISLL